MQTTHKKSEARIAIDPGFAWDGQDAYLFDIDGTLLRSRDRVHFESVANGVRRVTGFEVTLAGIALHGNTDTAILREACIRAGISADVLEPQIAAILDAMCASVEERRRELDPILMPGVQEALRHLSNRGALLGVATGNLEMIGWIKIEAAGLREWFQFGGFSDHFPVRSEMVGHAARKARALAGERATVCVVGDTPRDIEAARANSLAVIAVATGNFDFDALYEFRPDVCATSLADLIAATGTAQ
ncbi:MAG TPA: HAD family hydrolase [Terracidiphilus sp.]|jgi:phosphoglycolate phosphatase-like HAD superfamily hydrolase|nr:HAD family hydrolase [Terracidiphilus sp.]